MAKLTPTPIPGDRREVARLHQAQYLASCPSRKVVSTRLVEVQQPQARRARRKPDRVFAKLECGHEVMGLTSTGGIHAFSDYAKCPACGPGAR